MYICLKLYAKHIWHIHVYSGVFIVIVKKTESLFIPFVFIYLAKWIMS